MSKFKSNFPPVSDLELLDNVIFYLSQLCHDLPFSLLQHHCLGAAASLFELYIFLNEHNLKNYGDYKK